MMRGHYAYYGISGNYRPIPSRQPFLPDTRDGRSAIRTTHLGQGIVECVVLTGT